MQTIDMTPTWAEITSYLLLAIRDAGPRGRAQAEIELERMAKLADIASVILGAHRRPDAPAEPEAEAIAHKLAAFAAIETWGPSEPARYPLDLLDVDARPHA